MYEIPWSAPVSLTMLDGRCRTVIGPLDAMKCLQSEWPVRGGAYYSYAMRACEAAVKRRKSPSEARAAFVCASREAFLTILAGQGREEGSDGYRPLE
ncbi:MULTISPECIES: DUF982 domain-containing protein [Sinorhizobium]|uniref:DUF982 domain-containing protein n=1 Tax=Sinorhizobium psoraleae TaxID=520838 RepID=A0ABT4KRP5_9HYPH|nr:MULTISPECIES: DUF982 domain-containing protein [Sinorhizobium]MCZ4094623.1 DUF982 domain-containing protein [Sinorhizobium psoraleae]MDK1385282.1 DUF982 domain-containing protein [Sinorhizobium sp. 7-81]NRP72392.1 hypothetical protein [Sinorhizobium psoraleae]